MTYKVINQGEQTSLAPGPIGDRNAGDGFRADGRNMALKAPLDLVAAQKSLRGPGAEELAAARRQTPDALMARHVLAVGGGR